MVEVLLVAADAYILDGRFADIGFRGSRAEAVLKSFFPFLEGDLPEHYLYPPRLPPYRGLWRLVLGAVSVLGVSSRPLDPVQAFYPPCFPPLGSSSLMS